MRTISFGSRFRKDFKREIRGRHAKTLVADLKAVTDMLCSDKLLPARYADHALVGQWFGDRDCHIKPELILIYRKVDGPGDAHAILQLVRIGSHSELSL